MRPLLQRKNGCEGDIAPSAFFLYKIEGMVSQAKRDVLPLGLAEELNSPLSFRIFFFSGAYVLLYCFFFISVYLYTMYVIDTSTSVSEGTPASVVFLIYYNEQPNKVKYNGCGTRNYDTYIHTCTR